MYSMRVFGSSSDSRLLLLGIFVIFERDSFMHLRARDFSVGVFKAICFAACQAAELNCLFKNHFLLGVNPKS